MSEMSDAFEEMLDAQEEALGRREKCKIDGQEIDILLGDAGLEIVPGEGGDYMEGSVTGCIRFADVLELPTKGTPFVFRDRDDLEVQSAERVNDTIRIIASHLVATD
jgi:hypothetical protein